MIAMKEKNYATSGEPRLDDSLRDPHPDEIAEKPTDGHQAADLPERCVCDAEADNEHVAQRREETDEGEPDATSLEEMLHVADLGLLDSYPVLNPVERGETAYQIVGRCTQPVAQKDPQQGGPDRPPQGNGGTQGSLTAHRDATAGYETAKRQSGIAPGENFVHLSGVY